MMRGGDLGGCDVGARGGVKCLLGCDWTFVVMR